MFSQYTKTASYIVSDGEKTSEGQLSVTRSQNNTIEFISPDTLSGIVVQSDETGKEGTYTLSFDGVSTDVPKSLMGKISLIFMLISDDTASGAKKLDKNAFTKVTDNTVLEQYQGAIPYKAKLNVSGTDIMLIYDSLSGDILSMSAFSKDDSATLIFNTQE